MPVVGALLLLTIDGDLGGIHVGHNSLGQIASFYSADLVPIDAGQADEVLLCGRHFGLEGL